MKVFITGGAGFVGSHLTKSLLEKSHSVTVYDNFDTSSKDNPRLQGAKVICGDILDDKLLDESMSGHDCLIHLAAKTSVAESLESPEKTNQTNVSGTINVLSACKKNHIKRFVAASSAAVYGDPADLPISENTPANPQSPYGASKLALEYYVKSFSNCFGIDAISLRLFNVYGVGQNIEYAGVITKFAQRIQEGKPLEIFGDGTQTRDFVSVDDVVSAFECAIQNVSKKRGIPYNIASGKYVSIEELARTMIELSGASISIQRKDTRQGDIKHSQCTIFYAKKDLGYSPKVELREGLDSFLNSSNLS